MGRCTKKSIKLKLRSIQRTIIRYITRSFKSVSYNALITLSNYIPIDIKVKEITCNRYFIYKQYSFTPILQKIYLFNTRKIGTHLYCRLNETFLLSNTPPWPIENKYLLHPSQGNVNIPTAHEDSWAVFVIYVKKRKTDVGWFVTNY